MHQPKRVRAARPGRPRGGPCPGAEGIRAPVLATEIVGPAASISGRRRPVATPARAAIWYHAGVLILWC
jgi:hypothetical protein